MKLINTTIRRNTIAIAAIVAIAVPGLASAGLIDRAKSGLQTVKTKTGIVVTNIKQSQPLANTVNNVKDTTQEIFDNVKQLHVVEQLRDTMGLVQQMQADYQYFSGGQGCGASCASFRNRLKNVFNSFGQLVSEVPALSNESGLVDNLQRASNLIDYLPPRALYLMWQAMSSKLADLETAANDISQTLANLPPLRPTGGLSTRTMNNTAPTTSNFRSTIGGAVNNTIDGYCGWKDMQDDPWVKMVRARLDMFGWTVEKFEGMIPDVSVKGQGGGTAGVGVANAEAAAGVAVKPTDGVKLTLKVVAFIPQRISKVIEMNILQANAFCQ